MECIYPEDVRELKSFIRERRDLGNRPIYIFPCGGDEKEHVSRKHLRGYLKRAKSPSLHNVICLTAEDVATRNELADLSLVQQEAILADICDWILIFAESVGSICELGIFSSLPHALRVTSVVIDERYKDEKSFMADGPVREIEKSGKLLNQVFYANFDCVFSNPKLEAFINDLRDHIKNDGGERRKYNDDVSNLNVGSLVHELMDLLQIVGPITSADLLNLYCELKGFTAKSKMRISSPTLQADMKSTVSISFEQVISIMDAVGIIRQQKRARDRARDKLNLTPAVHLESYFMFKSTDSREFARIRSRILLRKRRKGIWGGKNVYC